MSTTNNTQEDASGGGGAATAATNESDGIIHNCDGDVKMLYKVTVIGDINVGKTSLIRRLTEGKFSEAYKATIGVDFGTIHIKLGGDKYVLQLWDIAGNETSRTEMLKPYMRDSKGIFVVCSVDLETSIDKAVVWKQAAYDKLADAGSSTDVPCCLLINKSDMLEGQTAPRNFKQFAEANGFNSHHLVSAKTYQMVEEAVVNMLIEIRKRDPSSKPPPEAVPIDLTPLQKSKSSCCS